MATIPWETTHSVETNARPAFAWHYWTNIANWDDPPVIQHPEIKSLGPDGEKCKPYTRGLLRRMTIKGGLQHCIGKEVSRFEQGKDDFIENIDDVCIHYDGGRVAANESLVTEISARGLRKTTKETGLDRKTIRGILNGKKVKASTLAKVVIGLRQE